MRRRFSPDIPETLQDACDPATMTVIVYDMQVGVVQQLVDGGAETVERVSRVVTAARAGGYPLFFTRHMSLPVGLMGVAQLRTAMAWQHVDDPEKVESWFLRDTPGFQIVPDLSPRADEAVFDKLAMSAFAGTPLETALRDTDNEGDRLTPQGAADAETTGRGGLHPPYAAFVSTGAARVTQMLETLRHAAGQDDTPITAATGLRSSVENRWRDAARAAGKRADLEDIRAIDPDLVERES
jgi:hypothetical protein